MAKKHPIWVDDREGGPSSDRVTDVFADVFGDDKVTVKRLESGDVVCPGVQAAAERKRIDDFLGSLGDKRMWSQYREMDRRFEANCVVVEGSHIEDFVAEMYGGHFAAVKKLLGTLAWVDNQEGWSAFWAQPDGDEGTRLLAHYLAAWFRQVEKAQES